MMAAYITHMAPNFSRNLRHSILSERCSLGLVRILMNLGFGQRWPLNQIQFQSGDCENHRWRKRGWYRQRGRWLGHRSEKKKNYIPSFEFWVNFTSSSFFLGPEPQTKGKITNLTKTLSLLGSTCFDTLQWSSHPSRWSGLQVAGTDSRRESTSVHI